MTRTSPEPVSINHQRQVHYLYVANKIGDLGLTLAVIYAIVFHVVPMLDRTNQPTGIGFHSNPEREI